MVIFFLVFLSSQLEKEKPFIIQHYIAGNWSSKSNNQLHTLYFIPISNIKHYQALLNDKFLDIYINSLLSIQVIFEKFNFSLNFKKIGSYFYANSKIEENYFIDVFIYSRDVVDISFINSTKSEILTWTFQRPIPQITTKDKFVVISFFSGAFILIIYGIIFRCCCK